MLNAHDNAKEYFIEKPFFFVMLAVDILILKMNYLSTRRNVRNFKAQQQYLIATFVMKMLHVGRGWPKPKSSGLNQEPTKKKASRLGTWFWDFSSSWYPVRYPFADFLVRPGTSGLKFLVQPGSSWINQEVLGSTRKILPFPRPFLFFIGKFFGNGSILHYKKWTMV